MNVACNSPDTVSHRAFISLELQAYRSGCVGFWAVFRCYKAERWGLDSL